jgi:competence protein ComEC
VDKIRAKLLAWQQEQRPAETLLSKIYDSPLVLSAIFLGAGIVLQYYFAMSLWFWIFGAVSLLTFTIYFYASKSDSRWRIFAIVFAGSLCFLMLGGVRLISYQTLPPNDISKLVIGDDAIATLRGEIISEPTVQTFDGWQMAKFKFGDPGSSFHFKIHSVLSDEKFCPSSGTIKVYVGQAVLDLSIGDNIELLCSLGRFTSADNPGQFDTKRYMADNNIHISGFAKSRGNIKILEKDQAWYLGFKRLFAKKVSFFLLEHSPDENVSSLLEALLIGNRKNISPEIIRAFTRTGLIHFVSLSGLHVGIMTGFVWIVLNLFFTGKGVKAAIGILFIILFLMVVPPTAPTVRAIIITFFMCLAIMLDKRASLFNALAVSWIVILLIKPTDMFSAGFQLSFACVAGILLFASRIKILLDTVSEKLFSQNANILIVASTKIFYSFIALLSAGLAAWVGGFGVLLFHFHNINILSAVWTAFVFPLIWLVLVIGMLKILIAGIFPTAAAGLAWLVNNLITALICIVKLISESVDNQILTGEIAIWLIILYYCFIWIYINGYLIKPSLRKFSYIVCTAVLLIGFTANVYFNKRPSGFILNCLSVGAGQSIVIQADGENFIFDAGSISKNDVGNSVILPFLKHCGIEKLKSAFISHDDIDHFNAFPELLNEIQIESIGLNLEFQRNESDSATVKFIRSKLDENKITTLFNSPGIMCGLGASIKLLWPMNNVFESNNFSDNDRSDVYLVEYAGRKILLCSDIEKNTQAQLLLLYPDLQADVMILPHHGSRKSSLDDFIKKINPQITIASCSSKQYGNINKRILRNPFYTAIDGCVTVKIDSAGAITTSTYKKKEPGD